METSEYICSCPGNPSNQLGLDILFYWLCACIHLDVLPTTVCWNIYWYVIKNTKHNYCRGIVWQSVLLKSSWLLQNCSQNCCILKAYKCNKCMTLKSLWPLSPVVSKLPLLKCTLLPVSIWQFKVQNSMCFTIPTWTYHSKYQYMLYFTK